MTTVFKVGDVVRLRAERAQRATTRVARVDGDYITYSSSATKSVLWHAYADQLELVSRAAPPTFTSCTDHAAPPTCANEKPKPTRLEAARAALYEAVQRPHALTGRTTRALADELIAAAKAEASAEFARGGAWDTFQRLVDERQAPEPKPYGRVLATASATCSNYRCEGDDVEMTFTVRVPVHAAIARAHIHETNYRVTATSKGER